MLNKLPFRGPLSRVRNGRLSHSGNNGDVPGKTDGPEARFARYAGFDVFCTLFMRNPRTSQILPEPRLLQV